MSWYKVVYKSEPNRVDILWPLGLHPDREAALRCFNAAGPKRAGIDIGPFKLDDTVSYVSDYSLVEQQLLYGPEVSHPLYKV